MLFRDIIIFRALRFFILVFRYLFDVSSLFQSILFFSFFTLFFQCYTIFFRHSFPSFFLLRLFFISIHIFLLIFSDIYDISLFHIVFIDIFIYFYASVSYYFHFLIEIFCHCYYLYIDYFLLFSEVDRSHIFLSSLSWFHILLISLQSFWFHFSLRWFSWPLWFSAFFLMLLPLRFFCLFTELSQSLSHCFCFYSLIIFMMRHAPLMRCRPITFRDI